MQVGMSCEDDNNRSTIKHTIPVVKHNSWSKVLLCQDILISRNE